MAVIDVLYILGNGSLYGDEELRFSLRSLDKFGRRVGRVFITGRCPDFIDKSTVIFTPEIDIGKPMINHWWKVNQTFKNTDIGEKALLMYDDIFFTKPTDLPNYPWFWRGTLPEVKPHGEYQECLFNAHEWLYKQDLPVKDYECHTPCVYHKDAFLKMEKDYEQLKLWDSPMAVRSVYANQYVMNDQYRQDLKIRANVDSLLRVVGDRECFSIADDCLEGPVYEWIMDELQMKSRWEK